LNEGVLAGLDRKDLGERCPPGILECRLFDFAFALYRRCRGAPALGDPDSSGFDLF
jgi:hypothetical protein